jgi:hypothetical protein
MIQPPVVDVNTGNRLVLLNFQFWGFLVPDKQQARKVVSHSNSVGVLIDPAVLAWPISI